MPYLTVQDLRNEGVDSPSFTDAWLTDRIAIATEAFEDATGRYFERRDNQTVQLSGTGSKVLRFVVPPVAIDALDSVTADDELVDPSYYRVYIPDGRYGKLYARLLRLTGKWPKGTGNVVVVGSFGIVDDAGNTPRLVKRAVTILATMYLPKVADLDSRRSHRIIEEELRDYRYKLSESGRAGYFGDDEVDRVVAMYRGLSVAAV